MKRKLASLITALLCLTAIVSVIPVNAAEVALNEDNTYTVNVDADFVVIGIDYCDNGSGKAAYIIISHIDSETGTIGKYPGYLSYCASYIDGITFQVGDLIKFDGGYEVLDGIPTDFIPFEETKAILNVGNYVDVCGEEYEEVFRAAAAFGQAYMLTLPYDDISDECDWGDVTVNWGDVNEDEQIDILDCIALNKNMLGGNSLNAYAKLIADVDMNGVLDSTDSLSILKEVVGLTVNYEPAVD